VSRLLLRGKKTKTLTTATSIDQADLIEQISLSADIPKTEAKKALEALVDGIVAGLVADKRVVMQGLGTLWPIKRRRKIQLPKPGKKGFSAFKGGTVQASMITYHLKFVPNTKLAEDLGVRKPRKPRG
jgi:nucleoid DNA-binding protein